MTFWCFLCIYLLNSSAVNSALDEKELRWMHWLTQGEAGMFWGLKKLEIYLSSCQLFNCFLKSYPFESSNKYEDAGRYLDGELQGSQVATCFLCSHTTQRWRSFRPAGHSALVGAFGQTGLSFKLLSVGAGLESGINSTCWRHAYSFLPWLGFTVPTSLVTPSFLQHAKPERKKWAAARQYHDLIDQVKSFKSGFYDVHANLDEPLIRFQICWSAEQRQLSIRNWKSPECGYMLVLDKLTREIDACTAFWIS